MEKHIDKEITPPTFIWTTAGDTAGDPVNTLKYATALNEAKIPFELHIYPTGGHGMGLAPQKPHVTSWAPLSAAWLKDELEFDFAK